MARRRTMNRFAKENRGAVTIEFVIMMPLFVAALAFAYEFGQVFLAYQSTASNVRSAARYLSRLDNPSANEFRARRIIQTGQVETGVTPFRYLDEACDGSGPSGDCIDVIGSTIRIDVQIAYPLTLFGFIGGAAGATLPIRVVETTQWMGS